MAKTQFIDGTFLTPAFMTAQFGTNAGTGHDHKGSNADGSCPIIPITDINIPWTEFGVDVSSSYFTSPVSNQKWDYCKISNMVYIYVKTPLSGAHTANTQLKVSPNGGSWPTAIVPATNQLVGGIIIQKCDTVVNYRNGAVIITSGASTVWEFWCPDDNSVLDNDHFGTVSSQPKGILRQIFSYCVL